LFYDNREKDWQNLKRELSRNHGLLQTVKLISRFYHRYNSLWDVVENARKNRWDDPIFDRILRPLIEMLKASSGEAWNSLMLALFWPAMLSLSGKFRSYDADEDARWSNVVLAFLRTVNNPVLFNRKRGLATKIYYDTRHRLFEIYLLPKDVATIPKKIIAEQIEFVIRDNIARRWDRQRFVEKLNAILNSESITPLEYNLIKGSLIYEEPLEICAESLGLTYEAAKKLRQRAVRKMKNQ